MKFEIYSLRGIFKKIFWQIVFEWEDDFSKSHQLSITRIKSLERNFFTKIYYHEKIYSLVPKRNKHEVYKLIFFMVAPHKYNFFSAPNYIPIIIDAWKPGLDRIKKFCKFNKFVFLGSLEAVNELRSEGVSNVYYSPVSISEKRRRNSYTIKDIDLLVYGRNHFEMFDWVEMLWKEPHLHIVRTKRDEDGKFYAYSNQFGCIGEVEERDKLIALIIRSKYTTVSSTGNDPRYKENYEHTGGFSPVTPRFLECVACYSQGVGMFPSNPDFNYFDMEKVVIKTSTFEDFKLVINRPINEELLKKTFDDFLEKHWSKNRLEQIIEIVNHS